MTDFNHIQFNADKHRYYIGERELTAVTKWIRQFQTPFDQKGQAERMANKPGETRLAEDFIAEWEQTGKDARELGQRVHEYIANVLTGKKESDPYLSLNNQHSSDLEASGFETAWSQMSDYSTPTHVEWVIGDEKLGLGGTVDCVIFNDTQGVYHVFDWKTGKFTQRNNWGKKLLLPFDDLDDCSLNVYSLQLSAYRLILERNTDLTIDDSYIVHLTPHGFTVHKALDFRERILACMEGGVKEN